MIEFDLQKRLVSRHGELAFSAAATIRAGERVALFGPSGAGKTTLLRMLAGLTRPDSGRLVVGDEVWFDAARGIDLPPQRRRIGLVFQDYALFPHLTVRGNLAFAAHTPARVDELLALMGLEALANRKPDTLSGGQKQRVALARALAWEPALLLLDEPLSALDPALRSRLQQELLRVHEALKLTTVLVSHDLAEVFRLASRVIRLEDGVVTGDATPAELFLTRQAAGRFRLAGEVLAIRDEDVLQIASLLVGGEIVDVVLDDDEAAQLRVGQRVTVAAKAFSPLVFPAGD